MSTRTDPLMDAELRPDRLHFATGVMLDREDFQAEQLYHRGRLARALAGPAQRRRRRRAGLRPCGRRLALGL